MAKEIIFLNLESEMLKARVNKAELAAMIDISAGSMSSKFTGKTEFNLDEMLLIKERLESLTDQEFTLDYLFSKEA